MCCQKGTNCILGNKGPLCLSCDNDSGYFGKYGNCYKCDGKYKAILRIIFFLGFMLVLLFLTL